MNSFGNLTRGAARTACWEAAREGSQKYCSPQAISALAAGVAGGEREVAGCGRGVAGWTPRAPVGGRLTGGGDSGWRQSRRRCRRITTVQTVASRSPVSIAVDAGTTGVRALVVDERAGVVDVAYREIHQYFPRPGWVEHDPVEIWEAVRATRAEVAGRLADGNRVARAIGVTNQRETVGAWDRGTGEPLALAIVWQDRRTAAACRALAAAGYLPLIRERTGLVLDSYFSATKMQWLLREGGLSLGGDLGFGTVDAWVLWNLTGGADGGVFATDATNACRTLLYDIVVRRWSDELCS